MTDQTRYSTKKIINSDVIVEEFKLDLAKNKREGGSITWVSFPVIVPSLMPPKQTAKEAAAGTYTGSNGHIMEPLHF